MSKCNGDCFNCVFDDCILDEHESVPKIEKADTKLSYYERNKESRRAYQREYARKKYGYKPKVDKPKKTEEEIKEYKRQVAKAYYQANREKCIAENRKYYKEHRDYFLRKSRERYKRICEERRAAE